MMLINDNEQSIANMVESFNQAAQSMKNLTASLQMYPNAIITGKDY